MRDPSAEPGLSPELRARLECLLEPEATPAARRAIEDDAPTEPAPVDEQPGAAQRLLSQARSFGKRHVAAIVVVAAAGVAFGLWNVFQARSTEVAPSAHAVAVATSVAAVPASTPSATLVVHVVGAVARPGVVRLDAGARVADALEAAGGLRPDADPAQLNLAAQIGDGDQIVVGTTAAPAGEVRSGGGGAGAGGAGPPPDGGSSQAQVNLNTATQAQLEALPGVGPVTAGKIIAWRTQHGKFTRVEELGEVDGIGPKTLAQLKPHVRV